MGVHRTWGQAREGELTAPHVFLHGSRLTAHGRYSLPDVQGAQGKEG